MMMCMRNKKTRMSSDEHYLKANKEMPFLEWCLASSLRNNCGTTHRICMIPRIFYEMLDINDLLELDNIIYVILLCRTHQNL